MGYILRMNHAYPACLSLHRLHLSVNLGRWDDERARLQPVEVSIRFFFPVLPEACENDNAKVFCYDQLSLALSEFVAGKHFLLIEHLTVQLFKAIRSNMRAQMGEGYDPVKVWVRLHKFGAPIPALTGGASFVYTDLPEGVITAHE